MRIRLRDGSPSRQAWIRAQEHTRSRTVNNKTDYYSLGCARIIEMLTDPAAFDIHQGFGRQCVEALARRRLVLIFRCNGNFSSDHIRQFGLSYFNTLKRKSDMQEVHSTLYRFLGLIFGIS